MKNLKKHIKYAFFSGIVTFVLMKLIYVLLGSKMNLNLNLLIQFFWYMMYAVILYTTNVAVYQFFEKKYGK